MNADRLIRGWSHTRSARQAVKPAITAVGRDVKAYRKNKRPHREQAEA